MLTSFARLEQRIAIHTAPVAEGLTGDPSNDDFQSEGAAPSTIPKVEHGALRIVGVVHAQSPPSHGANFEVPRAF
jgi:hypothetical protein